MLWWLHFFIYFFNRSSGLCESITQLIASFNGMRTHTELSHKNMNDIYMYIMVITYKASNFTSNKNIVESLYAFMAFAFLKICTFWLYYRTVTSISSIITLVFMITIVCIGNAVRVFALTYFFIHYLNSDCFSDWYQCNHNSNGLLHCLQFSLYSESTGVILILNAQIVG